MAIPDEYVHLKYIIDKLKAIPQIEQRTAAWYEYRKSRITASDTATALDLNPYECIESFILKKTGHEVPFQDNMHTYHGKKYEPIATLLYQHIFNTIVDEYGVIVSDMYPFLGASPDGICSEKTLDGKFSNKFGTMLEIKCPVTRNIETIGDRIGVICPFYYYTQIQQQLLCCNLFNCDFWQCKITEYKTKAMYLKDTCDDSFIIDIDSESSNLLSQNKQLYKGAILMFHPIDYVPRFEGDQIDWQAKFVYPNNLLVNYDKWCKQQQNTIIDGYKFNKVIYWKLSMACNLTINIDNIFINWMVATLKLTWSRILYYRETSTNIDMLRDTVEKRKSKYMKLKINYTIHNEDIVKNKILFLDESFDTYKYLSEDNDLTFLM